MVSSRGAASATIDDMKHKVFQADGRYWVFYQDSSLEFGFKSSADGVHWSQFTPVIAEPGGVGDSANAVYDPVYNRVWIVTGEVYNSSKINYNFGTPEPNGTISWSGPTRQELIPYTNPLPDAVIDPSGVMWNTEVTNVSSNEMYVFRNGTMVAPVVASASDTAVIGMLVPSGPGEMYAVVGGGDWQTGPLQIFYTTDGGRSWGHPVNVTGTFLVDGASAVAVNGTLYVAAGSCPGPTSYTYRMGAGGIKDVRLLDNLSSDFRGPVADAAIATDGANKLLVVYTNGTSVFAMTSLDGGRDWGQRATLMHGVQLVNTPFSVDPVITFGFASTVWESQYYTVWFHSVAVPSASRPRNFTTAATTFCEAWPSPNILFERAKGALPALMARLYPRTMAARSLPTRNAAPAFTISPQSVVSLAIRAGFPSQ